MPATANFFTQTPGLSALTKLAAGYSQQRHIPPFAPETFKHWFAQTRRRETPDEPQVILWADTFNNHFTPAVAKAAVEVLEDAGFQVIVPAQQPVLRPAAVRLRHARHGQATASRRSSTRCASPFVRAVPIVGLEPSCMTVFRDELVNLLPGDEDAKRLSAQTFILSEFLHDHARITSRQRSSARRWCMAIATTSPSCTSRRRSDLLKKAGVDCEVPDSGCCGMAGSFGYEDDHYQVGLDCGERVLLPSVRRSRTTTLVVTDGFSCREMIRQETDRSARSLRAGAADGHQGGPGRPGGRPSPNGGTRPSSERRRFRSESSREAYSPEQAFGGLLRRKKPSRTRALS